VHALHQHSDTIDFPDYSTKNQISNEHQHCDILDLAVNTEYEKPANLILGVPYSNFTQQHFHLISFYSKDPSFFFLRGPPQA